MPTFVTRLDLVNGQSLRVGHPWPGEEGFPVGLIVERGEVAEQDDDGSVVTFPAHFEVWLLPEHLREEIYRFFGQAYAGSAPAPTAMLGALGAVPNAPCRKIAMSRVDFTEEVWSMEEAYPVIQDFFEQKLSVDEEEEEPEEEQPAPVAIAQANGPQGHD
jgi:hypothetical protein